MEKPEKLQKLKADDNQPMTRKLLDKRNKKQSPSSTSSSKKPEDLKENSESAEKPPDEKTASRADTPSRSSPEPNCAICLETLQNKSFTDSCFHTFCFTCLVEWSKVKPECPLCKQQFKSIVHNVRNDCSFDEYHIQSRSNSNLWACYGIGTAASTEQRFRYATTMTTSRIMERNLASYQETYQSQIASHRMRYAPHSVRMYSNAQIMARMPCGLRRSVYDHNLWVRPPERGRKRLVSPEFYRRNPACTHRLLPWLNRELGTLLDYNETQITFVLELIMALVARYEITSQEFLIHIEPYMGSRTRHFIHELYHFATSPYEMENYDRNADYSSALYAQEARAAVPDNDIVQIFTEENNARVSPPLDPRHERKQQMRAYRRLRTLVLKKNGENIWESITAPASNVTNFSNPGPSTSSSSTYLPIEGTSGDSTSVPASINSDDEDCQVLEVLKPKSERTPEIVDLSSDEEASRPVIFVSSGTESSSPIMSPVSTPRLGSPTSSPEFGLLSHLKDITELKIFNYSPVSSPIFQPSPASSDGFSSDIECLYHSEKPSSSKEITKTSQELSVGKVDENKESKNQGTASVSTNEEPLDCSSNSSRKKLPTLASAIVRPWAMKNAQTPPREQSPCPKQKRPSSSFLDDSLTESISDNGTPKERNPSPPKKLKLRSVVAHFSFDHSDSRHDSSHRSSHKKHKDKKKKKKKKHMHKHKRRIYSDSDSS